MESRRPPHESTHNIQIPEIQQSFDEEFEMERPADKILDRPVSGFGRTAATTRLDKNRPVKESIGQTLGSPKRILLQPISQEAKGMHIALYTSLREGEFDHIKYLISRDDELTAEIADLEQLTPQENTPLHIVARCNGPEELIKLILSRSPRQRTQENLNGDCPLHVAARAGHLTPDKCIVEFAGPDLELLEKQNGDGETALHIGVRYEHAEVARYLISADPRPTKSFWFCLNRRYESPLFLTAALGDKDLVEAMLKRSPLVNDTLIPKMGKSVIQAAIFGGNPEVLDAILYMHPFLINSTMSIPKEGHISPLSYAALKGNTEMVRLIMGCFNECTYIRNPSLNFPIHVAAGADHKSVVKEFLMYSPDSRELLTSSGHNILHIACLQGKHDMVSYILSLTDLFHPINPRENFDELINARDNNSNTPLHLAVAAKYPKVVDALTWDKRVRLDLVNNNGQTVMDFALKYDNPVPSLKEELVWLALRYAGAPRRSFLQANLSNISEQALIDNYKEQINTLSVVATLVTTMSFGAGFTMPGGNSGSDPNLGMANFLKRRIFELFVISNSAALYTSVLNVLVLIFAMLGDVKLLQVSLKVAVPMLAASLGAMSISFMSAAYLVVSSLRWLGIVVWVMGSVFLAVVLALFLLLFPTMSAKNRFTRYLAYLPFRVMLYICERNE